MGLNEVSGIRIGKGTPGKLNLITDVPGVTVGHATIQDGDVNTGVTVIRPHAGNIYEEKVMAASLVINGFGKTMGLVQIDELGTIETPIALTNTLSIGTVATALSRYTIQQTPGACSINPVVGECNDSALNDICGFHVKEEHVFQALENTSEIFEEGAIGAGTGMSCLGFKGGIGSSSRVVELDGKIYTIGGLVLANFGRPGNLRIDGEKEGERILPLLEAQEMLDKGSIIMLIATDIPLNERQLKRVCRRAGVGLARVGSYYGHGSGDIVIGFTTANKIPHIPQKAILPMQMMADAQIDPVLWLTADVIEEAVLSALMHAKTTKGKDGTIRHSLTEFLEK